MIKNGEIYFYLKDDEHGWLSNFYFSPFVYRGTCFPTNENYYQAHKAIDRDMYLWIANAPKPYHAMMAGRRLRKDKGEIWEDWDSIKLVVMKDGLRLKFKIPHLRDKLLKTGDMFLHEDSPTDKFWGIKGEDWLGKLLMEVREEIKNDKQHI